MRECIIEREDENFTREDNNLLLLKGTELANLCVDTIAETE